MSVNHRSVEASPEAVFAVLANGWLYPVWVVGASRMRDVEESWPAVGSKIYHSVGVWPALIDDSTSVLEWDPPRRMTLQARLWPVGEATVTVEAEPSPSGCELTITEQATSGPFAMLPSPMSEVPIKVRNIETLKRLAYLAEGGAEPTGGDPAQS